MQGNLPTQAAAPVPPVVVVGGDTNRRPEEVTRIIRESDADGGGAGRPGILSRLAEGVVPDATRRAENAAALGERRREDDMRREAETRRADQLRTEEASRRFLEQNRTAEEGRRAEEGARRNADMIRAIVPGAAGGAAASAPTRAVDGQSHPPSDQIGISALTDCMFSFMLLSQMLLERLSAWRIERSKPNVAARTASRPWSRLSLNRSPLSLSSPQSSRLAQLLPR